METENTALQPGIGSESFPITLAKEMFTLEQGITNPLAEAIMKDSITLAPDETTYITIGEMYNFGYPVGRNILNDIKCADALINAFLFIREFEGRKINLLCTGSSGAIIATMFALRLRDRVQICYVYKDGESSHNDEGTEVTPDKSSINVIVDDFIASGATMNFIYSNNNGSRKDIDCVCVCRQSNGYEPIHFKPKYMVCGYK